ncbi:hypothetical protein BGZ96_005194 [Linnemannia gamsii]|uniref:GDP-fucose protein O-fucosyltransferase 2 n=1 Tax=Linnemannia gamsii TaxID=64522 RepID=A0ABQ7K4F8_9FUNG|nr:hypothetical protein BGZ96_005194 [Linnemannia gamsii]
MKGFARNGQSQGLKNRTLFILVAIILISAWTLLTTMDLASFQLYSGNSNDNNNNNVGQHKDQSTLPQQPLDTNTNNGTNPNYSHDDNYDSYDNNDNDNNGQPLVSATLKPPVSNLDANTKYLSFLPFGGLTNQFIAVQSAAYIALKLNRTLILPPIISNSHDHKNTHQQWSQYMDLPKLTQLTGLSVLEWSQVRPLTEEQRQVGLDQALQSTHLSGPYHSETETWASVAENITCQIVYGYGNPDLDINFSAQNFMFHFLIRPVFVPPVAARPDAPVYDNDRQRLVHDNQNPEDLVIVEDLLDRYSDYDSRTPEDRAAGKADMLFLSHTFKIKTIDRGGVYWKEAGKNMHFEPKIMEYATLKINEVVQGDHNIEVLPNNDPEEVELTEEEHQNPVSEDGTLVTDIQAPTTRIPHIAVHLRRGDIWTKCRGANRAVENCVLPFEKYSDAVERAREYAAKSLGLVSHLPVVVATDSTSEEDFAKIQELGWHRLDHSKYGTTEIWGTFGPAMVDAAILAHADVLVGSGVSTMSRIAGMRQKGWYNHESFFPSLEDGPKMVRRRRMMMKRRLETEVERDDLDDEILMIF